MGVLEVKEDGGIAAGGQYGLLQLSKRLPHLLVKLREPLELNRPGRQELLDCRNRCPTDNSPETYLRGRCSIRG